MANVIRRVVIEELYDNYNYDITFHKDGITLITGPNGFGKTTVLNIIKNALEQNFLYFYEEAPSFRHQLSCYKPFLS